MDAIQRNLINSHLKNMKTGALIGRLVPPPMPMPDLLKKLTVIPANSEIINIALLSKYNFYLLEIVKYLILQFYVIN